MWQAAGCGCQLVSTLLLPERRPGHLRPLPWPFPGLAWRPRPPLAPPGLTPGSRSFLPHRLSLAGASAGQLGHVASGGLRRGELLGHLPQAH